MVAKASHVPKPDNRAGNVPCFSWGAGSHSAKGTDECPSHREGRRELGTIVLCTTIWAFLELRFHSRENRSLEMLHTYWITWWCNLNSFFWFHVHALSPSGFQHHSFLLWHTYSVPVTRGDLCNLPEQHVQSHIGGWGHDVNMCSCIFLFLCRWGWASFQKLRAPESSVSLGLLGELPLTIPC